MAAWKNSRKNWLNILQRFGASEGSFSGECTRRPTIRKLLCFMLLPHNGKAFGATGEIYGTLQGKTSPLASFLDSKVEYDDDGRVAGGGWKGKWGLVARFFRKNRHVYFYYNRTSSHTHKPRHHKYLLRTNLLWCRCWNSSQTELAIFPHLPSLRRSLALLNMCNNALRCWKNSFAETFCGGAEGKSHFYHLEALKAGRSVSLGFALQPVLWWCKTKGLTRSSSCVSILKLSPPALARRAIIFISRSVKTKTFMPSEGAER